MIDVYPLTGFVTFGSLGHNASAITGVISQQFAWSTYPWVQVQVLVQVFFPLLFVQTPQQAAAPQPWGSLPQSWGVATPLVRQHVLCHY